MLEVAYRLVLACPAYVVLSQYYDYEHISTVHPQTLGEYRLVEIREAGREVVYDQLWPARRNRRRLVSRVRHRYVGPLTMEFDFLEGRYAGTGVRTRLTPQGKASTLVEELSKELNPEQIPEGRGHCYRRGTRAVAVFNVRGRVYALDNRCPHTGGPLALGQVTDDGQCVACPWHGARFNLATGEHVAGPGHGGVEVVDLGRRDAVGAGSAPASRAEGSTSPATSSGEIRG